MEKTLYLLSGCTASGKTALALDWAERQGAEIISCDSMLFYRGMDIGTAKPTPAERRRVPHHLIDLVPVDQPFSVGRYVPLARRAVEEVVVRGRRPLVVGGSGLYLMSFLRPAVDDVRADPEIRRRVESLLREGGLARLLEELRRCNPGGLTGLDTDNPRRVARALERCWASGRTLAELEEDFRRQPPPFSEFRKEVCLLEREPAELDRRIERRAKAMIEKGLIDEVRALRERGIAKNPAAGRAIGYREILAWLESGEGGSREHLAETIAANTRKLVKKQRTWFRSQLPQARRIRRSGDPAEGAPELFG